MPFPLRSLTDWLSGVSRNRKVDQRRNRRRLLLEPLERRNLLASDLAAIAGIVFVDQTDDGLTADDVRLPGVTVNLFRDGGDGQFGGDDAFVGSSVTDGSGRYRFDDLGEGVYFVEQTAVPGLLQRPSETVQEVVITAADAGGTLGGSIDSFDVTAQTVEVSSLVPTSNSDSVAASEAIGGERDIFVELTAGAGDIEMKVRHLNRPILSFSADSGAVGRGIVTWDGPDNDADQLDADGLGGYDLTENGANLGIRLLQGADLPGGLVTVRVYTDAGNFSTFSQSIPQTPLGTADVETIFWFAGFTVAAGSGADFTDVGAIELEIQGVPSMDAQIDELGMIGPTVLARNFANLEPLSLGDTVWFDANNNGQLDSGELGIPGVVVTLYEDTDANGEFSPGVDVALGTDTTDASGIYGFGNLFPGDYIAQIGPANFAAGGALQGLVSSTGNDPVPDPNDGVDGDDNGYPVAGHGVVSLAITLSAGGVPDNNTDRDPNADLTLDFGFTALADLQVVKTDDPDPVTAGDTLTYTLVVTNHGPSPASGVVLTDPLPAGVTFQSVTTTQGTAGHAAGIITANLGDLGVDESATVTVVVTVDSSLTDGLQNTAQVTSDTVDPVPQNNQDSEPTDVQQRVNLSIVKRDAPDPVTAGQTLTYTLLVSNDGPSDATGVTVVDTLPQGVTFVSSTTSQGTIAHVGGTVTASLGNLAAGASATVTLTVDVSPSARGVLLNEAEVSATEEETDPDDNTDTAQTTVAAEVDLVLTKTDAPDPVVAGEQLVYTLLVRNDGPSDATGVTVTDTLPAGVQFVSADGAGTASNSGNVVTIELGDLAVGESATTTITVQVDPATRQSIVNTASVVAIENERNLQNNTDSVTTAVLAEIDLGIVKTDSPDPVAAAGTLTYTLLVTNNGPSQATGVTVTDVLPAGLTYVSGTATQGTVTATNGTVTASLGNLAPGGSATITLTTTVAGSLQGQIVNTASVSGNETDTEPDNDTSSQTTQIVPRVDLQITKSDAPDPVVAGENLTYTLLVTNNGPSSATGVSVVDTLPANVTFVSATSTQGTASHAAGTVTVNVGNLALNQTETITIVVTVPPSARGSLSNTATVSGNEEETNNSNNTSSVSTVIQPEIDLVIFKADSPDPVIAGQTLTYTLSVVNNGPSDATGVTVTDQLPSGVTFVSTTASQGTSANSNGTITANLGNLASGASATVTIVVTVNPSTRGTITNTANVTGTETETQPQNNSDSEPTVVQAQIDLAITKTDSPDPVTAGSQLTYTLTVTNNGPSSATAVSVQDVLPSQLQFVSATASQGTVTHSQGTVTATLGDLAVGASRTITIVTQVDAGFSGTLTNQATVTGTEPETTSGNNTASQSTVVNPLLSSLSGFVYVDLNNNGLKDAGEAPISGVTVRLTGTALNGSTVQRQQVTGSDGSYVFSDLPAGVYQMIQEQPQTYLDGRDTPGTVPTASVENNTFNGIQLEPGAQGTNFLFGERLPVFSKRLFLGR
ncbi:MAG: DUF11 domain-containing protein [Pirellulaceae bacterium]|nr:DUF11 domain-containing protein [Pirellulaceae bacterium]